MVLGVSFWTHLIYISKKQPRVHLSATSKAGHSKAGGQQVCNAANAPVLNRLIASFAALASAAKSMMHPHGYQSACLQCYRVWKSGHLYVWSPCKGLALRIRRPAHHSATTTGDSRRKATQQHGTASGSTPRLPPAAVWTLQKIRPPHSFAAASSCRFSMFFHESGLPWICAAQIHQ